MAINPLVSVRLTPEMVKRLDRLVPKIARDPAIAAIGNISRSTVIKMALVDGLVGLEKRYAEK